MADDITRPRPQGDEEVQDIQIMLKSGSNPLQVRELRVGDGNHGDGNHDDDEDGWDCTSII